MRIVTWNLNNRASNHDAWEALFSLDPDIALLCEVNFIPDDLRGHAHVFEQASGPQLAPRSFRTGLLVKGSIVAPIELRAAQPWVNDAIHAYFPGNVLGRRITLADGRDLSVFSIHMPSWPIPFRNFTSGDVSDVMLPNWDRMHLSELLWASLAHSAPALGADLIVGGDFNTSEFIGQNERQSAANREVIRRMAGLGLIEAVRAFNDGPVPTFHLRLRNRVFQHQLDHLYLSAPLIDALTRAEVGDLAAFRPLSDHLPVVADLGRP